jgi:predicted CXXCH cytochrome family protein
MAGRTRTTKKLAQRIDLDYFKTLHGIPRWRRILSVVFTLLGLGWLGWHGLRGSPTPYNAGPIARPHALIGHKCAACHVSAAGFQRAVTDNACQACHDGPIHHGEQTFSPACSDCHVEHKGMMRLASTSDRACAQCHADLAAKDKNAPPRFVAEISNFDRNHPEFAPLRSGQKDPGTIKFNHQVHLKKELRAPQGTVQLKCADCHRPPGLEEAWPFGEAEITPAIFSSPSRAYMSPVNYREHCSACHTLQFDRRFRESVPHKEPKVVYDFVVKKLTEYIAAHPDQIHTVDEPDKRLPTRPAPPPPRNAEEWVTQRLADAQLLLWRKACKECHALSYPQGPDSLPLVAKAAITTRWLPHASFDHEAHQLLGCTSCHARANSSKEAADVLIPGIQVCRECHRSGANAAEARCFECHVYHDWSKEKQVTAGYTVRQLVE